MMIQTFTEPMLPSAVQDKLRPLLDEAFPGLFDGRTYVKQQPHFRIIMHEGSDVVGHLAVDYRTVRIGSELVRICFVNDVCVRKDLRGRRIGSKLLEEVEVQARQAEVRFIVLMADLHAFYAHHGFLRMQGVSARYLRIRDCTSQSLDEEDLSDQLMAKPLTEFSWPEGSLDMLGYLP